MRKGLSSSEIFKNKYSLTDREHFKWVQLIDAVPKEWKDIIRSDSYENDPRTILDCSFMSKLNDQKRAWDIIKGCSLPQRLLF